MYAVFISDTIVQSITDLDNMSIVGPFDTLEAASEWAELNPRYIMFVMKVENP